MREICIATAYRGRGSRGVFEDDALFADYWTSYYTDFEPQSAFVVEEGGRVVGYLLGSVASRRYLRIMAMRIVPRLVALAFARLVAGRYREPTTKRFLLWYVRRGWRESIPIPSRFLQAHFHCNLLPCCTGKRYYSALGAAFVEHALASGATMMFTQSEETRAEGFWTRTALPVTPDEFHASRPSSFNREVLLSDTPLYLRAWAGPTTRFRDWLDRLSSRYGV